MFDLSSLRARILAVAIVPCLAVVGSTSLIVSEQWSRHAEMVQTEDLIELASRISAFTHEAQRERGASSLFIGAKGTQFGTELNAQRARTNTALAGLRERIAAQKLEIKEGPAGKIANDFIQRFEGLIDQRKVVDVLSVPASQAAAYYTGMIGSGLSLIRAMGGTMNEASTAARVNTYAAFLRMKEAAGQERAAVSAVLASGNYDLAASRPWRETR